MSRVAHHLARGNDQDMTMSRALPTKGFCEAAVALEIEEGHHGEIKRSPSSFAKGRRGPLSSSARNGVIHQTRLLMGPGGGTKPVLITAFEQIPRPDCSPRFELFF